MAHEYLVWPICFRITPAIAGDRNPGIFPIMFATDIIMDEYWGPISLGLHFAPAMLNAMIGVYGGLFTFFENVMDFFFQIFL